MRELAIYALESIACSGIMLLLYKILMEQRVDFRICRIYLPAALIISAIIPLLDIPVWAADVVYIQSQANMLPAETAPIEMTTVQMEVPRSIDLRPVVWGIYMLGVAISLILMLIQLRRISLLASRSEIIRPSNPRIIRAAENISSFSFFGTIYVGRDSTDHDVESIMIHECSHIRHNHSAERVAMELLCSLMWWNPFSWIARRHLMEVHEYEADADVLKSGYDVSIYIQTILKSLLGYSPDIANGLRDSLTQKRFKMMTRKTSSRYALLRTLAIVPMLAGLLCAFSFTAKATQYIDTSNATPDRKLLEIKVTDTQGKPMKGAVIILSDGHGYTTDENGRANVKNGSIEDLSINYVGHEVKSISVDNKADRAIVNVTMDVVPQYIVGATVSNYDKMKNSLAGAYDKHAQEAIEQTEKSFNRTFRPADAGEERFVKVEQAALYDGGNVNKFRNYIQSTVKYPTEAIKKKAHGNVSVEFIVEADASLSNIKVTKSPDYSLTNEVIRAINSAPLKWTPAKQRGEATRMKYYMTINFSLEKDDFFMKTTLVAKSTLFNGGDAADEFKKYMQKTLRYPKLAQQTKSVGRVVAIFSIDENGLPGNIDLPTPADDILAAEVTRAIANSRGWELVRYTDVPQDITQIGSVYCVAVDFSMQGENGIVTAPVSVNVTDKKLQDMYGKDYIGPVNVMVYDK